MSNTFLISHFGCTLCIMAASYLVTLGLIASTSVLSLTPSLQVTEQGAT